MTTPEFDVSPVGRSFAPPAADLCIFPLFLFAGKRFTPVARPAGLWGMSAAPDAGRCHRRRLSLLVGAKTYEADRKTEAGRQGRRAGGPAAPASTWRAETAPPPTVAIARARRIACAPSPACNCKRCSQSVGRSARLASPTRTSGCGNSLRSRMEISPNPPRLVRGRTARG